MKMPVLFKTLLSRSGTVGADQLVAVVDLEPSRGREAVGEIGFQIGPGVADDRLGGGRRFTSWTVRRRRGVRRRSLRPGRRFATGRSVLRTLLR